MKTFPEQPSDEVLAELVSEFCASLSIFGRSLGDGGAAEKLESTVPSMQPSIPAALVGAYLGGEGIYIPGAAPGIPDAWRTLRTHELERGTPGGGVHYRFTEYLPDANRLDAAPDSSHAGVAASVFASLVDGLKKTLGKPKVKRKEKADFEWGERGSPAWGGVYLTTGRSKEIKIGGGDSAPWAVAFFEIQLFGAPRS